MTILWKFNNINYQTIYTQEATKLPFTNFLVYFLLNLLSCMSNMLYIILISIYQQVHAIFDWTNILFLSFYFYRYNRLGKHQSLSKSFWKYLFAYSMRYLCEPDCFLGIWLFMVSKFSQTDLPQRPFMLGISWCLPDKNSEENNLIKSID